MNILSVKLSFLFALIFSQQLLAARILDGAYNETEKTVQLKIAYEAGCDESEFYINWVECGWDAKAKKTFLYGMLLAKEDVTACDVNVEQDLEFDISQIKCEPEMILIKSTSSKVPFLIQK